MEIYSKSYPVTAEDIDNLYRLSASGMLLFLQDAIASYMAVWRAAAFDVIEDNLFWVVLDYSARYANPVPYWSDDVTVSLSVTELTPIRVYFDFTMCGRDGRTFVQGTTIWSLLDRTTRHPYTLLHDYVLRKSGLDSSLMNVRHPRKKNQSAGELFSSCDYVVQTPDIDFNGHVCNRTYLSVAMGCIGVQEKVPASLEIKYIKETYPGDTLHCRCTFDGQYYLCEIKNSGDEPVCTVSVSFEDVPKTIDVRDAVLRK